MKMALGEALIFIDFLLSMSGFRGSGVSFFESID